MLQEFKKHIQNKLPFLKDKKLLIAISGGVDSVVLTHLLSALKFDISLAHCNFQLRAEESNLDETAVRNLGDKLHLKTFVTTFHIASTGSVQLAARKLRYDWFQKIIETHHFDVVLTAHHADDNLETFLINFTRGSGLDGFTGIPEINGNIVRPLLPFSREEIINFARENAIPWREDQSNASTKYVRNKIRHQVVPILKEINPNLLDTFSKTIENLTEGKQIIKDRVDEVSEQLFFEKDKTLRFDISKIQQLSNPKAYLYQLLKKFNFTEWTDIYNLLSAQSGKQVFSKSHVLLKDRESLILSERDFEIVEEASYLIPKNTLEIKKPVHLTFDKVEEKSSENLQTIYVDTTKISFPLIVRKWQNGDYFYPSGMKGKKKLSKYFKDEKLSLLEKQQTWLLCNNNNAIIWVINKRQDHRYIVKKDANLLKISLKATK
ncbi:tRNA lysidine(34) synthetase TilS [uncultured Polaribacter sp.]|uniref:tRNA lysidine(34) synthetase TilS n=1 Tax=uncultured Polaribacter sp. TaxID=174711 RepID=UPI0026276C1D|nr:tRNA lysidine(34) synthetase TilS [uncultured Polaribacter sp.]